MLSLLKLVLAGLSIKTAMLRLGSKPKPPDGEPDRRGWLIYASLGLSLLAIYPAVLGGGVGLSLLAGSLSSGAFSLSQLV